MPLGAPASEEMHLNLAYLLVSSARSAGKVMITRFFFGWTAKVAFMRATLPATPPRGFLEIMVRPR